MHIHPRATAGLVALTSLALAGCAAVEPPSTGVDHAAATAHVHAILADPTRDGFLVGTHEGIYTASADGQLGTRVGSFSFDAMGLTVVGDEILASGHPGSDTPAELGAPNLGIVRSGDGAETWQPVAFTGEKDFHALAAAPDGAVYGMASDSIEMLVSTDTGSAWSPTGASLMAFALAVDATGRIIATTPDGVQFSTDQGASFALMADAPALITVSASPDHRSIVGVDGKERIWVAVAGGTQWQEVGTAHGSAQAVAITETGDIIVVDDSGLTLLPASN